MRSPPGAPAASILSALRAVPSVGPPFVSLKGMSAFNSNISGLNGLVPSAIVSTPLGPISFELALANAQKALAKSVVPDTKAAIFAARSRQAIQSARQSVKMLNALQTLMPQQVEYTAQFNVLKLIQRFEASRTVPIGKLVNVVA